MMQFCDLLVIIDNMTSNIESDTIRQNVLLATLLLTSEVDICCRNNAMH